MRLAEDGVREESLIVHSSITIRARGAAYVEAEAVVKLVDERGDSWIGDAQIRIPVERVSVKAEGKQEKPRPVAPAET